MKMGKKSLAQKIVYQSLDLIFQEIKTDPSVIFKQAIINVTPSIEVRSRRVGGGNYQIPTPVAENRGFALASRWIINAARGKKGSPMAKKLSEEILDAYKGEGNAIKKKDDVYRMAEANKAFARFAYFVKKKKLI